MLHILDTGMSYAEDNMNLDAHFLNELRSDGVPILHLYHWSRPSATFGYFIKPEMHLDLQKAAFHGLDLARRPTGGGIVFHIWDLAFSFLMPSGHPAFSTNTLENYQFVNRIVLDTVKEFFQLKPELIPDDAPTIGADCQNFCMARPTQYDVVFEGMKIAGSAQRRRKQGYLHQGTISLCGANLALLKDVLLSQDVVSAMSRFTFAPIKNEKELKGIKIDLQKLLALKLKNALEFTA